MKIHLFKIENCINGQGNLFLLLSSWFMKCNLYIITFDNALSFICRLNVWEQRNTGDLRIGRAVRAVYRAHANRTVPPPINHYRWSTNQVILSTPTYRVPLWLVPSPPAIVILFSPTSMLLPTFAKQCPVAFPSYPSIPTILTLLFLINPIGTYVKPRKLALSSSMCSFHLSVLTFYCH